MKKKRYNISMILTDVHTHSTFSLDGISTLEDMVAEAHKKKIVYYGVSEHFDRDYAALGLKIHGEKPPFIDADAYFSAARRLQQEYTGKGLRMLVGGEYGFCNHPRCFEEYERLNRRYSPDFVVNSVHTTDGADCYFPDYFKGKSKEYAYSRYLETILESIDAPYSYDIIAHIGYVSRNAPYADKKLRYGEFDKIIDEILKKIVAKGKILEVNSSSRGAGSEFLPDSDILTRYYELGGRRVSFASDAHNTLRIAEKRELVAAALKRIGFTFLTVPDCGNYLQIEL